MFGVAYCPKSAGCAIVIPRRSHRRGQGREIMEAFVVFAGAICALVGVSIARFGDSELDQAIKGADKATAQRKKMGKALGHE
jgi:hypothetical protein